MKVLLIEPNSQFVIKSALGIFGPPLGLAYIASYIKKYSKHQVKILDASTLNYSIEDVEREIKEFRPDLVGLSVTSTPSIYDTYNYAKLVKNIDVNIFVAVGGQHVTFAPKETLKECKHIDFIIRGEGEETFLDLINKLDKKQSLRTVKGITYRDENKFIENPPRNLIKELDSIPHPAYDQLPMKRYRVGKKQFTSIITSRGCPYGCLFCASSRLVGKKWRARSAENVVEELKILKNKYKISEIEFIDDLFTMDPKRAKDICDFIIKEKLNISWTCSSRVDLIVRFPYLAKKLKEAGCHSIYVGAEAGTQKLLDIIKKGITLDQTGKAVKILKAAGLGVLASFVIGIPGETREDVEKTIKFAIELNPDFVQFTICTPFPGTPLYDEVKEKGMLLAKDWKEFTVISPVMKLENFEYRELKKLLQKAYISFYTRPKFIWNSIKARNFKLLAKIFSSGIRYALKR